MDHKFPYQVRKAAITGKQRIHFECPGCSTTVNFDLNDAGTQQPCPACGATFMVPGVREMQAEADAVKASQAAKAAKALEQAKIDADQRARQARARDEAQATAEAGSARKDEGPRTNGLGWLSTLTCVLSFICLFLAVSARTTVGDTYNIGLLNTRLCYAIGATGTFAASVVLYAIGALGDEVNRRGKAIQDAVAKGRAAQCGSKVEA